MEKTEAGLKGLYIREITTVSEKVHCSQLNIKRSFTQRTQTVTTDYILGSYHTDLL